MICIAEIIQIEEAVLPNADSYFNDISPLLGNISSFNGQFVPFGKFGNGHHKNFRTMVTRNEDHCAVLWEVRLVNWIGETLVMPKNSH